MKGIVTTCTYLSNPAADVCVHKTTYLCHMMWQKNI